MRRRVIVLAALLVTGGLAGAQTTPAGKAAPTAPADATGAKLDGYLQRWEQEMRKVQTLAAVLARTDKDKAFGTTTEFVGTAQYMKSGAGPSALNLAALELKLKGKADIADKFVCTGTYLYQFLPAQKEIRAYEMPKPKPGQVADDSFLGFLFGMKAEVAKRRYVLSLFKEDAYYIYVDITPRFPEDKAEFSRARMVLNKDNFLPRQLWFEHPNGNDVLWDIQRVQSGVTLDRRLFDAPKVPPDWKFVPVKKSTAEAPGAVPPRVVRPKD
jgi:TIGR03009 family protein